MGNDIDSNSITSKIDSFIKQDSYFSPTAANIQAVFNKEIGRLSEKPDEKTTLKGKVTELKEHIERQENGGFSWSITNVAYKYCYRFFSALWNGVFSGRDFTFKSSFEIAKEMENSLLSERICVEEIESESSSDTEESLEEKFSIFSDELHSLLSETENEKVTRQVKEYLSECSDKVYDKDYTITRADKKDGKIEISDPYSFFSLEKQGREDHEIEEVTISDEAYRDYHRIGFIRIQGEELKFIELEGKNIEKSKEEFASLIVKKLKSLGIHNTKVSALCEMFNQGVIAKIVEKIMVIPCLSCAGQKVVLPYQLDKGIEIEKNENDITFKYKIDVSVSIPGEEALGKQTLETRVSLPIAKMQTAEEITEDEFKVSHIYGKFEEGNFPLDKIE